jgi:hypothetical protein
LILGAICILYNYVFQVGVSKVWAFLAAIFIIIAPFVNELYDIYQAFRANNNGENNRIIVPNTSTHGENSPCNGHVNDTDKLRNIHTIEESVTIENVRIA